MKLLVVIDTHHTRSHTHAHTRPALQQPQQAPRPSSQPPAGLKHCQVQRPSPFFRQRDICVWRQVQVQAQAGTSTASHCCTHDVRGESLPLPGTGTFISISCETVRSILIGSFWARCVFCFFHPANPSAIEVLCVWMWAWAWALLFHVSISIWLCFPLLSIGKHN